MKTLFVATFVWIAGTVSLMQNAAAGSEALNQSKPVTVIELFTSEGCSSCPPAEARLNQMADQAGVVALSYHVDYWDYIGWVDPFASPKNTQRQRQYAQYFRERVIYTPQMVFQGDYHTPGTRVGQVEDGFAAARKVPQIPVSIHVGDDGRLHIEIGAGKGNDANVLLVTYIREAASQVTRGENAGRFLTHRNIVRSFERIGHWDDVELSLTTPPPAYTGAAIGCAVLLQERGGGRIIGAAAVNLNN